MGAPVIPAGYSRSKVTSLRTPGIPMALISRHTSGDTPLAITW
jgi:hypothetical protein